MMSLQRNLKFDSLPPDHQGPVRDHHYFCFFFYDIFQVCITETSVNGEKCAEDNQFFCSLEVLYPRDARRSIARDFSS